MILRNFNEPPKYLVLLPSFPCSHVVFALQVVLVVNSDGIAQLPAKNVC